MRKKYHLIINKEMKEKIYNFAIDNEMTLSGSVEFIFNKMEPVLDSYVYFEENNGDFGYEEVNGEIDFKFTMDKTFYNKLKNIHGIMFTFSIAVLVRRMISVFFEYLDFYGLSRLDKFLSKCKRVILKNIHLKQKWDKKKVHMYTGVMEKEYICMKFSSNYNLLGFKLLYKEEMLPV